MELKHNLCKVLGDALNKWLPSNLLTTNIVMHTPPTAKIAPLTPQLFSCIKDVPKEVWNKVLGSHSITFSHEFWQVIEKSGLNDFSYRYVLFFDETDQPVALAGFYAVTTDIAIFAPAKLRGILAKFRRIFPNFLKLGMLECGTPITLNSPPFVTNGTVSVTRVIEALNDVLTRIAKAEKKLLIVIRDFEPGTEALEPEFLQLNYCIVDSLPNNYLHIAWQQPQDYTLAMKSYYRSKLLKHLRRAEDIGIRHELVEDFSYLADTLCEQWLNVHHNAVEFQREVLTPNFYREISATMGSRSKAILFYQKDLLVGHVLLLVDGDVLRWLYFGRRESVKDSLYLYAAHKVIETAITLGVKQLEMGLTTYPIKQDMGSQVTPIKMAIKSPYALINPLVKIIYPLLNTIPHLENKNVFKSANPGEVA